MPGRSGASEAAGVSRTKLLRHRVGLKGTGPRLEGLLGRFRFGTAREVLEAVTGY